MNNQIITYLDSLLAGVLYFVFIKNYFVNLHMGFIEKYREQIKKLCEAYKVRSLYAFGSVNTPFFNAESDVDLVVDFETTDPLEYSENYFNLKFNLEKLLNRSIDLLENKAIRNSFLRKSIDKTKEIIYG